MNCLAMRSNQTSGVDLFYDLRSCACLNPLGERNYEMISITRESCHGHHMLYTRLNEQLNGPVHF